MKRWLLTSTVSVLLLMSGCSTPVEDQPAADSIGISDAYVETMSDERYLDLIGEHTELVENTSSIVADLMKLITEEPLLIMDSEWQDLFERSVALLTTEGLEVMAIDPLTVPVAFQEFHEIYIDSMEEMLMACSYYSEMIDFLREERVDDAVESFGKGTEHIQKSSNLMDKASNKLD